jgi:hypothetical protein
MADKQGDKAAYGQAIGRIGEAAQLRIDLERTNPVCSSPPPPHRSSSTTTSSRDLATFILTWFVFSQKKNERWRRSASALPGGTPRLVAGIRRAFRRRRELHHTSASLTCAVCGRGPPGAGGCEDAIELDRRTLVRSGPLLYREVHPRAPCSLKDHPSALF